MKKILSLIVLLFMAFGLLIPTIQARPLPPGDGTPPLPPELEISSNARYYMKELNVKFKANRKLGWFYTGTSIYISGVSVDFTTEGLDSWFEKDYYPYAYVGLHSVRVEAHYVNLNLETYNAETVKTFDVIYSADTDDLDDLRISELHEAPRYFDGTGVTICIIDDKIGCDVDYENEQGINFFHESLYRTCTGSYADIQYFADDNDDGVWTELWESHDLSAKWCCLYSRNDGQYTAIEDVHGTYVYSTIKQIAPDANYIFIEVDGSDLETRYECLDWLNTNDYYETLGIDIISMSWGPNYWDWILEDCYDDVESIFHQMATDSQNPVISVASSGNAAATYYTETGAYYPASFSDVIGVTGVPDSEHGDPSDRWNRDSRANTGYGVDVASIYEATTLLWDPVIGEDEFYGTSNSCPIVAGIIAILQDYKSSVDTISEIQTVLENTGDPSGYSPGSFDADGEYDSFFEVYYNEGPNDIDCPYQGELDPYTNIPPSWLARFLGWGIIDAYEMYLYIKQNF
ncbi:MAG: S8/S53 family peptidase [Asgard group archaeon]|nr:S8/S53 family peptidase [Asgard group archaeon]